MNNWFIDVFLKSFGKCKDKRISRKQYDVFYNNLRGFSYKIYNIDNGEREEFRFKGTIIILQCSTVLSILGYEYYVTVR